MYLHMLNSKDINFKSSLLILFKGIFFNFTVIQLIYSIYILLKRKVLNFNAILKLITKI